MLASYVPNGSTPVSPWEFLQFRSYLLQSNDKWDLQTFVMTLLSIKLFLREEEAGRIRIEDFREDLFLINELGEIEGVALTIQGKCDHVPVTLMLYGDSVNPLFCPLKHLFLYMHVFGIQSGYLFPSKDAYKEMISTDSTESLDHINYDSFLERFAYL